MLKHPRYLLSSPDLAPAAVGRRWGFWPLLVVARQLCLALQLDARGIPWHRTAAFVALQGTRLAPFIDPAGAYVRYGNVVHVWVWPAALQAAALARIGLTEGRVDVVPESLLGPVPEDGALFRACTSGMEALRFERGRLTAAAWWSQPLDEQARFAWAAAAPVIDEPLTAVQRAAGSGLWSVRWKSLSSPLLLHRPASPASRLARNAIPIAGLLVLCVSTGMVGYALREQQLLQSALDEAQQSLDSAMARASARSAQPGVAGSTPAGDPLWQQAQSAMRGLQVERVWAGLAMAFGDSGYVLRDFSFERDEVKLTLVSAYGGDVDLGSAIEALESSGLWRRVELLDFANPAVVRFGAKPREELFAVAGR